MQIFEYLKRDHEEVKDILAEMMETEAGQSEERQRLVGELKEHLLPHQQAEEGYFYEILFDETDEPASIHEDVEEHRASRFVLKDLEDTPIDSPAWEGVCKVLQELIEHHIEDEEDETFEIAKTVIDSKRAESVGKRFEEIENEAKSKMHA